MKQIEINEKIVDGIYTINAVSGFLIYLIDEFERIHRLQYCFKVKKYGNMFRDELLNSVNQVWLKGGEFDEKEISQQQMDSYLLAERLFSISVQITKNLTEEQRQKFDFSFQNLLYSFGVQPPEI